MNIPAILDHMLFPLFSIAKRRPRIFMFHSVGHSDTTLSTGEIGPRIDPDTFGHFARWLKQHANIVTVGEICTLSRRRRIFDQRVAAISLDDGYEDNYVNAYPILQELEIPATVYVTGDMIRYSSKDRGSGLTVGQIAEMSNFGIEFGAHSVTHPRLNRISVIDAQREILDSKALIEGITSTECKGFCYPYGAYNRTVRDMVEEAGFTYAVTTEDLAFRAHDMFLLQRTVLPASPQPSDFAIRLAGAHAWRQSVFRLANRSKHHWGKPSRFGLGRSHN